MVIFRTEPYDVKIEVTNDDGKYIIIIHFSLTYAVLQKIVLNLLKKIVFASKPFIEIKSKFYG